MGVEVGHNALLRLDISLFLEVSHFILRDGVGQLCGYVCCTPPVTLNTEQARRNQTRQAFGKLGGMDGKERREVLVGHGGITA